MGNHVTVESKLVDGQIVTNFKYNEGAVRSSWDWIAIYREEEKENRAYDGKQTSYVTQDQISLPAPRRAGRYVVRYFQSGSGYSELAVSNPIDIDDKDVMKVGASVVHGGDTIDVVWNIQSINPKSKDWVGLYRTGEFNPFLPLAMQHTYNLKPDGSLKFIVRKELQPGKYEFCFVQARSGTLVKRSDPFEILESE